MATAVRAAGLANIAVEDNIATIRTLVISAQVGQTADVTIKILIQPTAVIQAGRCAKAMIPAIRVCLGLVFVRPAEIMVNRVAPIHHTNAITALVIKIIYAGVAAAAAALLPAVVPVAGVS